MKWKVEFQWIDQGRQNEVLRKDLKTEELTDKLYITMQLGNLPSNGTEAAFQNNNDDELYNQSALFVHLLDLVYTPLVSVDHLSAYLPTYIPST